MSIDAALRLWEESNEVKGVRKNYRLALIALAITVTGILVDK